MNKAANVMEWKVEKVINDLFARWHGSAPEETAALPPSGSSRQYFRLKAGDMSVVAAFNPDPRENRAFLKLTGYFLELGLPVPHILAEDSDTHCYLMTDLGDTTLFSLLPHNDDQDAFNKEIMSLYKKTISFLPVFQLDAARKIDFGICYPRYAFDRHSMMWDLNYFKYYFLKISGVHFDEQLLEDDFERFTGRLTQYPSETFMYRDFQSRNIMILDRQPVFIDYQGGRKGPLPYDIASLLFDAKANIPFQQREELLEYYLDRLAEKVPLDRDSFRRSFFDFVVMRILQALGTYGFRGGVEKKPLFLQSVPYALKNLAWMDDQGLLPDNIPHLSGIIRKIARQKPAGMMPPPDDRLTVSVCSFSYKNGIPADNSGNGGGFVFDCRALPNPGRQQEYRALSGKDAEVSRLLASDKSVRQFLDAAAAMVEQSIQTYLERGFAKLAVCFGCTGGQHRSVYCAETLANTLREKYNINVTLQHFEEAHWPGQGINKIRTNNNPDT